MRLRDRRGVKDEAKAGEEFDMVEGQEVTGLDFSVLSPSDEVTHTGPCTKGY